MLQVVLGRRGSGKTTLAKTLLGQLHKPIIIWDTMREYPDFGHIYCDMADFLSECELTGAWTSSVLWLHDRDFATVCELIYRVGHVFFCVEEIDLYATPAAIDYWLSRLIRHGRHQQVDLLVISRRPAEISRHLTANADVLYVSQFCEPRDKDYCLSFGFPNIVLNSLTQYHFARLDIVSTNIRVTNSRLG